MKCKAGLCPAYVLPIEIENDQPQDLPPKGRYGTVTPGKYSPHRMEAHDRFFYGLPTLSLVQSYLRRDEAHTIVSHLSLSLFFASHRVTPLHFTTTNHVNKLHQFPLSTTTIHPFYQVNTILRFYSRFPFFLF